MTPSVANYLSKGFLNPLNKTLVHFRDLMKGTRSSYLQQKLVILSYVYNV